MHDGAQQQMGFRWPIRTRRNILSVKLANNDMTIAEVAENFQMTMSGGENDDPSRRQSYIGSPTQVAVEFP
jgi:hypothetical protein